MIRKLRRRIILINMLLMGVVILGIFTAVNINSYSNSVRTLERGINRLIDEGFDDGFSPPMAFGDATSDGKPLKFDKHDKRGDNEPPTEITSYIIVTINENGKIETTEEKNISLDAEDLQICVQQATGRNGQLGEYGLMYVTHEMKGQKKIAFAPNSSIYTELNSSLLVSALLFAGGMAGIFFISLFLSGLAVKPVKQAWEQQKQFVADASHELKTPLTVILANNNIMLSHPNSTVTDERQWLESTEEEANHMKKLIDNMLFLAKSDAGTAKVQLSEVNFSEITEKMDYIDVYNPDDEVAKSYGEKGKNGVMKIYTKKQADAIVYIVNGKIASKEDFNKLVPESIKKIKVLKRGTAAAMKASTDGDTHDVYMVTTK